VKCKYKPEILHCYGCIDCKVHKPARCTRIDEENMECEGHRFDLSACSRLDDQKWEREREV
jgi:hypothetical protein